MNQQYVEVLSAFFDGEAVDPDLLASSLEDPEATTFLLEFARLRRAVQEDRSRPDEEFCEAVRDRLAREEARGQLRRRFLRTSLAASLMLAAAAGGFSVRPLLDRRQPAQGRDARQVNPVRPAERPQVVTSPVTGTSDRIAGIPPLPADSPDLLRFRFTEWQREDMSRERP